jgi:hypothetical protein
MNWLETGTLSEVAALLLRSPHVRVKRGDFCNRHHKKGWVGNFLRCGLPAQPAQSQCKAVGRFSAADFAAKEILTNWMAKKGLTWAMPSASVTSSGEPSPVSGKGTEVRLTQNWWDIYSSRIGLLFR